MTYTVKTTKYLLTHASLDTFENNMIIGFVLCLDGMKYLGATKFAVVIRIGLDLRNGVIRFDWFQFKK